jgi:carboxymethylenebutenolidase
MTTIDHADIDSLVPSRSFDRRAFVRTSLGSGFAAAVLPVMAQTVIKTYTQGLEAGEVTIIASEIFGVHEHIADVARRFAKQGWLAIAPELFVRQGDAGSYGEIGKLIAEVINKVPDTQVMSDLDACVAWAEANGGATAKLGITGFCWGGRIVWLYAAHQPKVKAGVAWYGRLVGETNALQTRHPVEVAEQLKAPVLGLYGGQDQGIPLDTVERMKSMLAKGSDAARKSDFHVYADAPHGFHADYRPTYRKDAADDGWRRCLAWFKANGAA